MVKRLYVHLPFCRKKCPYCHFFVIKEDESKKEILLRALIKEASLYPIDFTKLETLYFGGGTPTLFGIERFKTFFSTLSPSLKAEITLEANPDDITLPYLQALRLIGFNRISIGLQSLVDLELNALGRTHNANRAIEAVHTAKKAGFENISVDLMFEIPNQTLASFDQTLKQVQKLPITHLSLYNLTFEKGAAFYRRQDEIQKQIVSDDVGKQMLDLACHRIEEMGLNRYEISAFAKPRFESKHNKGYWRAEPFIGLGPSAFSYQNRARFQNHLNLNRYLQDIDENKRPIHFYEKLQKSDQLNELLFVELRLLKGVDLDVFKKRHGSLPKETLNEIKLLMDEGFLSGSPLKLTEKGKLFYDSVAERIINYKMQK